MKPAIPRPKSSSSVTYEQLGYLESFDAVIDKLYALPEKTTAVAWPGVDSPETEDNDDFGAFYARYEQACRAKDRDFLKAILPADIPADEFEFVLNMSQQSALALEAAGIKPVFTPDGNRMDVIYEGDLGDGMTHMTIDFYLNKGNWLKYDAGA